LVKNIFINQHSALSTNYGPLSQALATVKADEQGFNGSLTQLEAGDKISAIATVPKYVLSNRLKRYYPFSQCSKTNPKSKTGGWKKFLLVPR
jgi:hypothetical protein